MIKKDYNNIYWNQYFECSNDSPSGLVWKVDRGRAKCSGKIAGSLKKYWFVGFNGELFATHRIVWVMNYGSINPDVEIDHIDGDTSNNSIDNLRLVDRTLNVRNCRKRHDNTSGSTGIYLYKNNGNVYYRASFYNEGKRKFKNFNIDKYGHDRAFELACEWRENMIAELDGYTDRHGK